MKYKTIIQIIVQNNDKTELERGDILIKDMSRLIVDLINYRYAVENYKGNQEGVLQDNLSKVKNSVALLMGDLDIYNEQVGITTKVEGRKTDRMNRIAKKIRILTM